MASRIDQRRLRDGAEGSAKIGQSLDGLSLDELRGRYWEMHGSSTAMQSLDDLGSAEANDAAWKECARLDRECARIKAEIKSRGGSLR